MSDFLARLLATTIRGDDEVEMLAGMPYGLHQSYVPRNDGVGGAFGRFWPWVKRKRLAHVELILIAHEAW